MALNSIWATACTSAARPSARASGRLGGLRGATRCGRAGRPGAPIGSGATAAGSASSTPRNTSCHAACVSRHFSAGSAQSRQRLAAVWRLVMMGKTPSSAAAPRLGIVRAQQLDLRQIGRVDAGDVFAGKARGVEVLERVVAVGDGPFEIGQV